MAADHSSVHKLRFTSSESKPLSYMAGQSISLGQFRADVEQLSAQLPVDGDVLICCTGRYAFSVALLTAWQNKKTVVLPSNNLDNSLHNIRKHHNISFECNAQWSQQLATFDHPERHGRWEIELPDYDQAVKLFTSGSTGTPKAITKSIGNLLDEAQVIATEFDWPAGAIVASIPPQHLYGLSFSILLPWVLGQAWVDDIPHYPNDIAQTLQQSNAPILISVPAHYKAILEDKTDLQGIFSVSAAAPLTDELARQWRQHFDTDILEVYGSTETGVVAHRKQLHAPDWKTFSRVTPSVQQNLLKVESPFVSNEFIQGFLTADRINMTEHGRFQLLGRADSIIKIAGKRVCLSDIERSICDCSGVAEAAVIAVPAKGVIRDIAIWAAVVANKNYRLSVKPLLANLRDKLTGIEMPRRIMIVEKLPRTANGKLPAAAIEKLFNKQNTNHV